MPDSPTELVEDTPDLESMKHAGKVAVWYECDEQLAKLRQTAETLTVTSVEQKDEMKLARATRLAFKNLRVQIEHKRKELGEYHLRQTQQINSDAKKLKDVIEQYEDKMLALEEFAERKQAEEEQAKRESRGAEIAPFLTGPVLADLGKISDEEYSRMLQDARDAREARLAREQKEREEAEAKAKAEAEERARVIAENKRLQKEAEEREAVLRKEREEAAAKLKAEQDAAIALRNKERAENDARLKVEQEKARVAREEIAARLKKEQEAREKIEAEAKAKKAAEEAAAKAPDREKLYALAAAIRALPLPVLSTQGPLMGLIREQVEKFALWVERKASTL